MRQAGLLLRGAAVGDTTPAGGIVHRQGQAILVRDGLIAWHGPEREMASGIEPDQEIDLGGRLVTPGLVDCHTHLVYAGTRVGDFVRRLTGTRYEEISSTGGGIASTVAATRAADEQDLFERARARLARMAANGATTVEIKSGYGLDAASEEKMLRVARRLGSTGIAEVRTTFLGAHAIPPGYQGSSREYLREMAEEVLPRLAARGLVDAVDAFCEAIAFGPEELEGYFLAAKRLGLPVKAHLDQLTETGGGGLLSRLGAASADHLEYSGTRTIAELAASGTVAVLLPGAYYFLRESRAPDVPALRAAGVPMAVATDHNPGTSPLESLPLAMNMACLLFGLTPAEALRGVTANAARALGLEDRGTITSGMRADLAVWNVDSPAELSYNIGYSPLYSTFVKGAMRREDPLHADANERA